MFSTRTQLISGVCVFACLLLYLPLYAGIGIILWICWAVANKKTDWFQQIGGTNGAVGIPTSGTLPRAKRQARPRVPPSSNPSLHHLQRIVSGSTPRPASASDSHNLSSSLSSFANNRSPSLSSQNVTPEVNPKLPIECINYNNSHPQSIRSRISPRFTSTPTAFPGSGGFARGVHPVSTTPPPNNIETKCPNVSPVQGLCNSGRLLQMASFSEKKSPFSGICQQRYVGPGLYPVVNLSPIPPVLLSNPNNSGKKSKLHYKSPHSEMLNAAKLRLGREIPPGSGPVASILTSNHSLSQRAVKKRSSKDQFTGSEAINKRSRADFPYFGEPVQPPSMISDGLIPYFDDQMMESATCLFSPCSPTKTPDLRMPETSAGKKSVTFKRRACSAIESSYSSSRRMLNKGVIAVKRKNVEFDAIGGESKRRISSIILDQPLLPSVSEVPSPVSIANQLSQDKNNSTGSLSLSKRMELPHEEVTPSELMTYRGPGQGDHQKSQRVRYVPTIADHMADRKIDEERLKTILSFISQKRKEDAEKEDNKDQDTGKDKMGSLAGTSTFGLLTATSLPSTSTANSISSPITFLSPTPISIASFTPTVASVQPNPPGTTLNVAFTNQVAPTTQPSSSYGVANFLSTAAAPPPSNSDAIKAEVTTATVPLPDSQPGSQAQAQTSTSFPLPPYTSSSTLFSTVPAISSTINDSALPLFGSAISTTASSVATSKPASFSFGLSGTTPAGNGTTLTSFLNPPASTNAGSPMTSPITSPTIAPSLMAGSNQPPTSTPNFAAAFQSPSFISSTVPNDGGSITSAVTSNSTSGTFAFGMTPATSTFGMTPATSTFGMTPATSTFGMTPATSTFGSSAPTPFASSVAMQSSPPSTTMVSPSNPTGNTNFAIMNNGVFGLNSTAGTTLTAFGQPQKNILKFEGTSNPSAPSGSQTQTAASPFANGVMGLTSPLSSRFGPPVGSTFGYSNGPQTSSLVPTGTSTTAPTNSIFGAQLSTGSSSSNFNPLGTLPKAGIAFGSALQTGGVSSLQGTTGGNFGNMGATTFTSQSGATFGAQVHSPFGGPGGSNTFGVAGGATFGAAPINTTTGNNLPAFGAVSQSGGNNIFGSTITQSAVGTSAFPSASTQFQSSSVAPNFTKMGAFASFQQPTGGGVNSQMPSTFAFGGNAAPPAASNTVTSTAGSAFNFGESNKVMLSGGFQFGGGQPTFQANPSMSTSTVSSSHNNNNNGSINFSAAGQSTSSFNIPGSQGFAFNPASPPSFNFGSGQAVSSPTPAPSMFAIGSGATPSSNRRMNRSLATRTRHR